MGRHMISRRRALQMGAAGLAALSIAPKGARAADELNLLVWCDHTGPALLELRPADPEGETSIDCGDAAICEPAGGGRITPLTIHGT